MKNSLPTPRSASLTRTVTLPLLAAALAVLAGCETTKLDEPAARAPVETRSPVAAAAAPAAANPAAATAATPASRVATVDLAAGAGAAAAGSAALMALPSQRVVYFDFDSFAIKDDYKAMIDSFAKALQAKRDTNLVIEGHTDERGGREYNLALGQKRAEAVLKSLTLLGAAEGQLEAVSFGKERPAATGSDEAAWAQNRRAELRVR